MSLTERAKSTLLIKLIAAATTYGFSILLARVMSPEGFGQVAFFLNAAFLLSVVGACGQQTALLRFIPVQTGAPEQMALRRAAFRLAATGTIVTFVVAVISTFFAIGKDVLTQFAGFSVVLGFALTLAVGWADFQAHLARGFHRIALALIPKEVLWRGITAIVVVFVFLGKGEVAASQVMVILLVSLIVITLSQHLILQELMTSRGGTRRGQLVHYGWKRAVGPFWLTSVSNVFLANADVIVVGMVLGARAAGFYFAANRLALLLGFFSTSYNVALAPMLSGVWQNGDQTQARIFLREATVRASIPTFVFGGLLLAFAPLALQMFGAEFTAATPALRLLLVAAMLNAATGPADIALNMCGYDRSAMRISAVSLVLNAGLLWFGVISGTITGVALAVLAGTALRKGLFWAAAWRQMGIRTDILAFGERAARLEPARG